MEKRALFNRIISAAALFLAALFLVSCSPKTLFPFLNRQEETAFEVSDNKEDSGGQKEDPGLPNETGEDPQGPQNGNAGNPAGPSESSAENPPASAEESAEVSEVLPDEFVLSADNLPEFAKEASVPVHEDMPFFREEDLTTESFVNYSPLDALGRCGPAFANISLSTLPEEERGLIGDVRPSGWQTVKYEGIDGNYLYNRCHLIAYCLAGDNASEENLITGTRYLNIIGMLPIELEVLDHVVKSRNHVLYRATPVFVGEELVARGVLIEAMSVEDHGEGLSLCRYCFNVQPGIEIDYATGESVQNEIIYMSDL